MGRDGTGRCTRPGKVCNTELVRCFGNRKRETHIQRKTKRKGKLCVQYYRWSAACLPAWLCLCVVWWSEYNVLLGRELFIRSRSSSLGEKHLWVKSDELRWVIAGADPGGGPGARAPPLTLGFEAPKLSIFGPYLIFPQFFFASLHSAYYFFYMLFIHSSNWKIFQPRFARHVISHLAILVSHILGY